MFIVTHRKIWYTISALLIVGSLAAVLVWGLKFGIDFTGGSLLEVAYSENAPTSKAAYDALEDIGVRGSSVRETDSGFL
ncbi:MAG: protein translocase subunit SecF, partial [Patescibacteria group bacterium]